MNEARLAAIAAAIRAGNLRYSGHGLIQMGVRGIDPVELETALSLEETEIIEDYPSDQRGPSCLVLTHTGGRALHVTLSYSPEPTVITAYWPDSRPDEWDAAFRRRLQ